MIINFVGTFNQPGYVGEISDETHLARELEALGHTVNRVQRDQWKAFVDGEEKQSDWNLPIEADINIIGKWHHFNDGKYIHSLRDLSRAGTGSSKSGGVFYWVWDFMPYPEIPEWHMEMCKAADLYLSGEAGIFDQYRKEGVRPYYFQMDVCDSQIPVFHKEKKIHDVIFTGSCIDQGHRKEWLQKINEQIKIKIWAWNHQDWQDLGFEAYPAVYEEEYNKLISQSKIVLGFSVEPNCFGYWSNRVGKVLKAGGFLLQEYAPGMEQMLPLGAVKFFSSVDEAIEMLWYYLSSIEHSDKKSFVASKVGARFTSKSKVRQLSVLMDRFLKGEPSQWLL